MIPSINKQGNPLFRTAARRLAAAGHRLTGPRRAVLNCIASQPGAFTAADLVDAFSATPEVGRATIFRTLDLLVDLQLLERVHREASGATGFAYVLCSLSDTHHHHTVCIRCGKVGDLEGCFLDKVRVDDLALRGAFRVLDHHLELYGTCGACSQVEDAKERAI